MLYVVAFVLVLPFSLHICHDLLKLFKRCQIQIQKIHILQFLHTITRYKNQMSATINCFYCNSWRCCQFFGPAAAMKRLQLKTKLKEKKTKNYFIVRECQRKCQEDFIKITNYYYSEKGEL